MITKVWPIIAASLVLLGGILFTGVMTTLDWDFMKLSTVKYETTTYEISDEFDSIAFDTDTADIEFVLSDDGKCRVECYENTNTKYSVVVEDDTLTVELIDKISVHNFIGLNFSSPKIMVYLPASEYTSLVISEDTGNVKIPADFAFVNVDISLSTGKVDFYASALDEIKIKASTGSVNIENIFAGSLDIAVTTGAVYVSDVICDGDITVDVTTGDSNLINVSCNNLISGGNTGDISLNNVVAIEKFSIERSTGDIKFEYSDAAEISVDTDTGRVSGTLQSSKVFVTKTDTGRVDVPKTTDGGLCEIKTDTGDIYITIAY